MIKLRWEYNENGWAKLRRRNPETYGVNDPALRVSLPHLFFRVRFIPDSATRLRIAREKT
jgi:hypothetical protein